MLPTATEILKKSYALYRANMKLFLLYTLFLILPLLAKEIYQSVLMVKFFPELTPFFANPNELFQASVPISAFILPGLILMAISLLTFFGVCMLIRVIANAYEGNTSNSLVSNLSSTTKIFIPAAIVSALSFVLITLGLFIFVIPGILFSIWFFFSTYSAVLDEKKGVAALKYSKSLVNNRWWDVFWIVFATTVVVVICSMIAGSLWKFFITFLQTLTGFGFMGIVGFIGNTAIDMIITPYSAVISTLIYLELKK